MAWTYANYNSQGTTALRLTTLRLHMDEVGAQISAAVTADGKSRNTADLVAYLKMLQEREEYFMGLPDATSAVNGGVSRARLIRGND